MTTNCTHLDQIKNVTPKADGCEECLKTGATWVSLRVCQTCGYAGCCEDSQGQHALKHFKATGHPIIQNLVPKNNIMRWCYIDEMSV